MSEADVSIGSSLVTSVCVVVAVSSDEVEEMIHNGMDYSMIESKLAEIHPFADFTGGSGVTIIEYWLDETGNDKILLIREQENIIHVVDSSNDSEDLYDVLM